MKALSKILLLSSFVLVLPQAANAQGAKGLQCLMFPSGTNKNNGDEGIATAQISRPGFVLTGGGCEVLMADGKTPSKPPGLYQNKPDGNRWLCRVHNDQGPIGGFTITAYAIGCQLN